MAEAMLCCRQGRGTFRLLVGISTDHAGLRRSTALGKGFPVVGGSAAPHPRFQIHALPGDRQPTRPRPTVHQRPTENDSRRLKHFTRLLTYSLTGSLAQVT